MMRGLLWNVRMYLRLLSVQLRSQMSYRVSFWMELLSTGLANGLYFVSLALVLDRFEGVTGWSLAEIAFLFGMIEASFGTMDLIYSGFDPDYFAVLVREGRFDQVMLRPVGVSWQVLGSRFLLRRLGRVFEGLLILAIGLAQLDLEWTLAKILYLPIVFASQVLTMGALFMIGSTLTFWTLQSIEAVNILTYGGTDLMSYPMQIYPRWMQRFFTYVVPFIFLNFYPALFILDKPDPLGFPAFSPFLAPLVSALFFFVAVKFWRVGLDHYQSAGS